jgi:hypothetical protein
VEQTLETYIPSDGLETAAQKLKRRISQIDFAQNYFRLDPDAASWGRSEIAEALKDPSKAFELLQQKLSHVQERERQRLERIFFELLDNAFLAGKKLNGDWLEAIVERSPAFIGEDDKGRRTSFFEPDMQDRLRLIVLHGLQNVSVSDRFYLLKEVIKTANDVSLICDVVRSILSDTNPEGAKEKHRRIDLESNGEEIRSMLLIRVRNLANSGEIWSQVRPDHILWFWWGSNFADEVQSFLAEAMNTSTGLLKLLEITVGSVMSSAGNFERVNISTWSKIVDLNQLALRAKAIHVSSNNELERQTAERFLRALDRNNRDYDL